MNDLLSKRILCSLYVGYGLDSVGGAPDSGGFNNGSFAVSAVVNRPPSGLGRRPPSARRINSARGNQLRANSDELDDFKRLDPILDPVANFSSIAGYKRMEPDSDPVARFSPIADTNRVSPVLAPVGMFSPIAGDRFSHVSSNNKGRSESLDDEMDKGTNDHVDVFMARVSSFGKRQIKVHKAPADDTQHATVDDMIDTLMCEDIN